MKSQFERTLSTWAVANKGNKLSVNYSRHFFLLVKAAEKAPFFRLYSHELYVTFFYYTDLLWLKAFFIEIVIERRLILRYSIFHILRVASAAPYSVPLWLEIQQVVIWSIIINYKTVPCLVVLLSRRSFVMNYF